MNSTPTVRVASFSLTKIAQMLTSRIGRKPLLLALATTLACLRTATAMRFHKDTPLAEKRQMYSTAIEELKHIVHKQKNDNDDATGKEQNIEKLAGYEAGLRELDQYEQPDHLQPGEHPGREPEHDLQPGAAHSGQRPNEEYTDGALTEADHDLQPGSELPPPPTAVPYPWEKEALRNDINGYRKQSKTPMQRLDSLIKESNKIEHKHTKAILIGGSTLLTAGGAMVGIQIGEAIQDASKSDFGKINDFATISGIIIVVLILCLMFWASSLLNEHLGGFQKKLYTYGAMSMTVGLGFTVGAMLQSANITKITEGALAGEYTGKGETTALLVTGVVFVVVALLLFAFMYFAPKEENKWQIARNVGAAVTAIGGLAGVAGSTFGILQEGVHDTHYEAEQIMGAADHVYVFMILGTLVTLAAFYYLLGGSFGKDFNRYDGVAVGTMVASTVSLALGIAGVGWYAEANKVAEGAEMGTQDDLRSFFSSEHATGIYFAIVFLLAFITILAVKKCNNKGNEVIGI